MLEQLISEYKNNNLRLSIKVQAGAKKSAFDGFWQSSFKLKIAAPAQDGKANQEIIDFLSKNLKIKKRQISIISGELNSNKIIEISELTKNELLLKLKEYF